MRASAWPTRAAHPLLWRALEEDLGVAGDLTTDAVVPSGTRARGVVIARRGCRVSGLGVALETFRLLDPDVDIELRGADGGDAAAGEPLATVAGDARALLTGERTALNVLGRLCGVATVTRDLVAAVADTGVAVCATRKTTPGLRALERAAVRDGGGADHRFGLDDAVLIKDNHRLLAGSLTAAVTRARAAVGHLVKVEVEVDTLEELDEALALGVDAILLDNMDVGRLRAAVAAADGRAVLEASGGITPATAPGIAATGVDLLSVGWLTHSAPAVDVAFDLDGPPAG